MRTPLETVLGLGLARLLARPQRGDPKKVIVQATLGQPLSNQARLESSQQHPTRLFESICTFQRSPLTILMPLGSYRDLTGTSSRMNIAASSNRSFKQKAASMRKSIRTKVCNRKSSSSRTKFFSSKASCQRSRLRVPATLPSQRSTRSGSLLRKRSSPVLSTSLRTFSTNATKKLPRSKSNLTFR